jgi:hypothetical protein
VAPLVGLDVHQGTLAVPVADGQPGEGLVPARRSPSLTTPRLGGQDPS